MYVAVCIFDAMRIKVHPAQFFCQLARRLLMFFENLMIGHCAHAGRPGGMRRRAGGRFEGS